MPAYFVDTPKEEINDILNINVNGTIRTTYAILPGMVQRYATINTQDLVAHSGSESVV